MGKNGERLERLERLGGIGGIDSCVNDLVREATGETLGIAGKKITEEANRKGMIRRDHLAALLWGSALVKQSELDRLECENTNNVYPHFGRPIDVNKEIEKRREDVKKEKRASDWLVNRELGENRRKVREGRDEAMQVTINVLAEVAKRGIKKGKRKVLLNDQGMEAIEKLFE